MKLLLGIELVMFAAGAVPGGQPVVKLEMQKETVEITVGGEEFAVYNFAKKLPRPFLFPVRGPRGAMMTRPLENPKDHPHHKGIWVAVDEVNGVRFWGGKGRIENVSVKLLIPQGNPARLQVVNQWLGKDGKPTITETTVISIHANRLLTYDITFRAGKQPVTFGDTKEGLFGFRMADSMREKVGGHVVNADGLKGSAACWGRFSHWVDYYGQIDGKTYGLAIFDHPKNFRRSRFHVRDYGLFSISPFGEHAYSKGKNPADPLRLPPGKSVRLRYGMYIHAGDTQTARVAETYRDYLKTSKN